MKRMFGVLLAAILLLMPHLSTQAVENITPVIDVLKYNGETYEEATDATTGDLIMIRISFSRQISSLASLRVKLEFPNEIVSYVGGSFQPELLDGDVTAGDPVLNSKEGSITVFFGKGGLVAGDSDEILGGKEAQTIASFVFKCDKKAEGAEFKATIDNALTAGYEEVIMTAKTVIKKLTISSWNLTDHAKSVFESLATITYNPAKDTALPDDSMQQIETAEAIYKKYSASEKLQFATQYPDLFENYRTARTRYYDEGLKASQEQLKAAAQLYRDTYHDAYNLSAAEVNLDNYILVREAIDAWETLDENSPQVTLLLLDEKSKLDALEPVVQKIEEMVQADAEAKEWFIDRYANTLWNSEVEMVDSESYEEYSPIVASAKSDYGSLLLESLSDEVKSQVEQYYKKLLELEEKVKEEAKKAGEDASIQEEITAFTEKWISVTRLNVMTVGVKDTSALEMYLEDFKTLSETAQTRLASRKTMVEQLLAYVKNLSNTQGSASSNTGINTVPQGGTTIEVLKEVPVETFIEKVTNTSILRKVPAIVYISMILMGIAVLSIPIPLLLIRKYYKRKSEQKGE